MGAPPEPACALQTDAYTAKELKSSVDEGSLDAGATCEDSIRLAFKYAKAFGADFSKAKVKELKSDDGTARFRYTYDVDGSPDTGVVSLVRGPDNRWLVNASE